jgi:hypothetical protein
VKIRDTPTGKQVMRAPLDALALRGLRNVRGRIANFFVSKPILFDNK